MNYSEMTADQQNNQNDISDSLEKLPSSSQKMLGFLKIIEYLFLTTSISSGIINFVLPEEQKNQTVVIAGAVSLAIYIFLFLINKQVSQSSSNLMSELEIKKKAELYLITNGSHSASNPMSLARQKALRYCQELIEDYKKARNLSRTFYYGLQMLTIVFSGITPILVLVDKLEAGQAWLKWLPVICPAIASIVASIVTSFPFQKNWVAANTALELLEAEQEKFVLGVTPAYRCYDSSDEKDQEQKGKQVLENFIIQVNNIHLNQLQQGNEQQKESQPDPSSNSNSQQT